MAHQQLKERVCRVNKESVRAGLVTLTFGNVSGADRGAGVMAIKPSGVSYDALKPDDIIVLAIADGRVVEGKLRPSSDTATHVLLYQNFPHIGGVVHTHSHYATAWAQAGREIPCLGTTHADHFYGPVPVTRQLTPEEIQDQYELNTGNVIVERFAGGEPNPDQMPAVLVPGHAPFVWGPTPENALANAIALESVALMAVQTYAINPEVTPIPQPLLDKHYLRKHGPAAYYGQK